MAPETMMPFSASGVTELMARYAQNRLTYEEQRAWAQAKDTKKYLQDRNSLKCVRPQISISRFWPVFTLMQKHRFRANAKQDVASLISKRDRGFQLS